MDNPHVQDVELAYFAGLIDGEGTITLERTGNRRLSGVMGLAPKIIITNTDDSIIQFSINMFKRLGTNPHIKSQPAGYGTRKRTCYWVTIQGLTKCKKIIPHILPYLLAKNLQARLLMDFIEHRGKTNVAKGKPYGKYELNILEKVRALNHRGTSETENHGLRNKIVEVK